MAHAGILFCVCVLACVRLCVCACVCAWALSLMYVCACVGSFYSLQYPQGSGLSSLICAIFYNGRIFSVHTGPTRLLPWSENLDIWFTASGSGWRLSGLFHFWVHPTFNFIHVSFNTPFHITFEKSHDVEKNSVLKKKSSVEKILSAEKKKIHNYENVQCWEKSTVLKKIQCLSRETNLGCWHQSQMPDLCATLFLKCRSVKPVRQPSSSFLVILKSVPFLVSWCKTSRSWCFVLSKAYRCSVTHKYKSLVILRSFPSILNCCKTSKRSSCYAVKSF